MTDESSASWKPTTGLSQARIATIFEPVYVQANKVCMAILAVHLLLAFVMASYYSTWLMTFAIGVPALLIPLVMWRLMPLALLTRMAVGLSLQTFTALHIYQMHGMMEMHFFFFTAVTAMIVYQDLWAIVPGTVAIVLQHIVFAYLTNSGVNMCFFAERRVTLLKLAYHFGIAAVQVVLAGWAISYLRGRTIASYDFAEAAGAREISLTQMLAKIRGVVEQLASSSELLRDASGSINTGVRNQADSVQKTAASVEEISATLAETAQNASLASELSTAASNLAGEGNAAVLESVELMDALATSSREIYGLVDNIREIAFQTNLLSVNAAIEAAKAGDHGRSFAVVSAEVRQLAERSAATARDAAALIGTSVQRTKSSTTSVGSAGKVLINLVENSRNVSTSVASISGSAREQADAIGEISRAINALEQGASESAVQAANLMTVAEKVDLATQSLQALLPALPVDRKPQSLSDYAKANGSRRPVVDRASLPVLAGVR